MSDKLRDECVQSYIEFYKTEYQKAKGPEATKERHAQRVAIQHSATALFAKYPTQFPEIWRYISEAHVIRRARIDITIEQIAAVISAENSWKKSSGHAFEEIVVELVNEQLAAQTEKVYFMLQRDVSKLLANGEICNTMRDMKWFEGQISSGNFDAYGIVEDGEKKKIFGCIQSKTSIRERVKGDRELSTGAMNNFFWSIAVALNGEFLSMPKFVQMVNGNGAIYDSVGWHGMYIFSNEDALGNIYNLSSSIQPLIDHTLKASQDWLSQRQEIDRDWKP
jgi:hypothetical protein